VSPTLVHLSDVHLGFRAFPRRERGGNLRERDGTKAFQRAIQELARLRPEAVLLSGDLFHGPDPPSGALLAMTRGLGALQSLLPGVPVLAIAGERDTPLREADPGPVAILDALPGVEAAAGAARAVRLRGAGIHVLMVPARAVSSPPRPELRPDPDADFNVLLIRARAVENGHGSTSAEAVVDALAVDPGDWDYVALGGGHRAVSHLPHVWTAGSLERIGWDPWREATEEKGFVVFDLESGRGELHPVETRPVVDLAPIRTEPGDPGPGTRRLRHLVEAIPGGVEGKLLRVRLEGEVNAPDLGVEPGFLEGLRRHAAHLEIGLVGPAASSRRREPMSAEIQRRGAEGPGPGLHLLLDPGGGKVDRMLQRMRTDPVTGGWGEEGGRVHPRIREVLVGGGEVGELLEAAVLVDGRGGDMAGPPSAQRAFRSPRGFSTDEASGVDLKARLRAAIEDAVEAEGEVEARTLGWARDRQEAETRLQTYRDRARELKARIRALEAGASTCPACGRVLGDDGEGLLASLQEEWEMVVQDGRWWKRRREQLEDRPEDLRALESQARRFRARVSALSEEAPRTGIGTDVGGGSYPEDDGAPAQGDTPLLSPALLRRAGSHLLRWSEGLLHGIVPGPGGGCRVLDAGGERLPSPVELGGIRLCLHLALWEEVAERGEPLPGVVVLRDPDGRGVDPLLPLLAAFNLDRTAVLLVVAEEVPIPGDPLLRSVLRMGEDSERPGSRYLRLPRGPVRIDFGGGEGGGGVARVR
jgi:hypothetical protein